MSAAGVGGALVRMGRPRRPKIDGQEEDGPLLSIRNARARIGYEKVLIYE